MHTLKNSPSIFFILAVLLIFVSACGTTNQDILNADPEPVIEVFEIFEPGETGQVIQNLVIAPDGDVWGNTEREVVHFDGGAWQHYIPENLGVIQTVAVTPDGQVWAGGTGNGGSSSVSRYDGEKWIEEAYFEPVRDIAITAGGDVWIAALQQLSRFDGETWTNYTRSSGLPTDCVNTVAAAPDSSIWAASCYSDHQVIHFDGTAWETYNPGWGYVSAIEAASDGRIWIGAVGEKGTGAGFSFYDGSSWTTWEETAGMLDNNVMDLAVDSSGNVWLATEEGVCRFDSDRCATYLPDEIVYSVTLVSDNEIWFGLDRRAVKLVLFTS